MASSLYKGPGRMRQTKSLDVTPPCNRTGWCPGQSDGLSPMLLHCPETFRPRKVSGRSSLRAILKGIGLDASRMSPSREVKTDPGRTDGSQRMGCTPTTAKQM